MSEYSDIAFTFYVFKLSCMLIGKEFNFGDAQKVQHTKCNIQWSVVLYYSTLKNKITDICTCMYLHVFHSDIHNIILFFHYNYTLQLCYSVSSLFLIFI